MSRGLKAHYSDFRFSGNQVTPDEVDRYEQYQVINPSISATHFGTATAGTVSEVIAPGLGNTTADYPRNVAVVFSGSAAVSGTAVITGKDFYGSVVVETFGQAEGTQEAATVAGTQIFAQVTAATVTMGTGVIGSGTASIGVPTAATDTYFGLPSRIKGSADVKSITWSGGAGLSVPLNGGTIGAYVDATNNRFRGTETLEGTTTLTVLYKPAFIDERIAGTLANLTPL